MKKYLLFILLLSNCVLFAQTNANLDINDISAVINSNGQLFDPGTPKFQVPKNGDAQTINAANIWIGGIDAGHNLHLAAQVHAQNGYDFFYGPIATDYNAPSYLSTYNNVWKVNKTIVDDHIANYNMPGYVVPSSIANWPGNGNVANGEAAILAPYIDVNGSGTYDPGNGDYPDIRGDEAIYFIMNDDKQLHTETGGTKLGIEVHGMAYAFNSTDSALNQTVFLNYHIFNRSANSYDSVYFGTWADMEIGNWLDDYIGCDSTLNMFYAYNSSDTDGTGLPGSYGIHPPAQASVFLNQAISKFMYYNNDATMIGNPFTADQFYNYLKGVWKDGTPLTYGGNGYGGPTTANFAFSGNPESNTGWTEINGGNTGSDRRGVLSAGPFTFPAGGEMCVDVAFPFARDYSGTNLTSVALVRQRVLSIQSFYNNQNPSCQFVSAIDENVNRNDIVSIYPNPTTNSFMVSVSNYVKNGTITLFNALGEQVFSENFIGDSKTINCNLSAGIYFVQIRNENTLTVMKLLRQ